MGGGKYICVRGMKCVYESVRVSVIKKCTFRQHSFYVVIISALINI